MQVHDWRLLRGAAVPTAVVGLVAAVIAASVAGTSGLVGALIGLGVVVVFFAASMAALAWVSRVHPMLMMNVALLTYLVKIGVLFVFLLVFRDTTAFDRRSFAFTIVAATITWLVFEVRAFSRAKILYVDPTRSE